MHQEFDKSVYTVTFDIPDGKMPAKSPFKVKHFRQYNGNTVSPKGGHTAIFDIEDGKIYSSKCRNDEQFSRRKGILTCLQKALNTVVGNGYKAQIVSHKFHENGVIITLAKVDANVRHECYWLNGSAKRSNSGETIAL